MKKNLTLLLIALFVTLGFNANAQDVNPPKNVKAKFEKRHPNATDVKWQKTKKGNFKAVYKNKNKKKAKAFFDQKGKQFLVKVYLGKGGKNFKNEVASKYSEYKIRRIVQIRKGKEEKEVFYRVFVRKGNTVKVLRFTKDKKFEKELGEKEIKKMKEVEEESDEEA